MRYPLKVQAEFDQEPIFIVDQDDVTILEIKRTRNPRRDLYMAGGIKEFIETNFVGVMPSGEASSGIL